VILPVAAAAFSGALTWTFLEYVIHRWLGHHPRFRGNPFGLEHVRHHIEGDYFAPTWKKLVFAPVAAAVLGVPAILALGTSIGIAYAAGLLAFYGVYELLHRLEHVWEGIGPYGHPFQGHRIRPSTSTRAVATWRCTEARGA
jgi:hypothetical protein